jgi:hypothetical protein
MQKKLRALLLPVLLCHAVSACSANQTRAEWKADCVGRMQLGFPSDVDVAATTIKDREVYRDPPRSSFIDDEHSLLGNHLGFLGGIEVIHGLTEQQIDNHFLNEKEDKDFFRENARKPQNIEEPFVDLPVKNKIGYAFQAQNMLYLNLRLKDHIFIWNGYSNLTAEKKQHDYEVIINGARQRDMYETPNLQGVCLPYSFIQDDGLTERKIGMAYRLKSHPDITVWLEDSSAAEYDIATEEGKRHSKQAEPASRMNDFWSQYESPEETQVNTIWNVPNHLHSVKLDGREGKASFVEITHLEKPVKTTFHGKSEYRPKTIDYGYLAIVRGDAKAKQDTPDLRFYVIRNAESAIKKGIKPLDKDEFLKLAEEIAATVKHRPSQ